MKYRTIIIDDESKLREVLAIKLRKNCPNIEIVGLAKDVPDAYRMILNKKPELIFLDISMPGESGFDLLNRFEKIEFEIIFATGYNEYALDALKVSAVDYLLKPIKTTELINAVERAEQRIAEKRQVQNIDLLKYNIDHLGDQKSKIAIPSGDTYRFVEVIEIIRCEGWQKYTRIYLSDGDNIVSSYNIGHYKDILESYGFFNCHKSHLINKNHIKSYSKDGLLTMSDDSSVPVSRRKREEFMVLFVK